MRVRRRLGLGVVALAGLAACIVASACQRADTDTANDGSSDASGNHETAVVDADASVSPDSMACLGADAAGALEPVFGDGAIVLLKNPVEDPTGAASTRVQADGKVVIGARILGTPVLIRLLANGSPDPDFGVNGVVKTQLPDAGYSAQPHGSYAALGIQPDGKIVAAAQISWGTGSVLMVVRYLVNGALDPSFGNGGMVTADFDEAPYALAVLGGGQILVSGTGDVAVARYNADGTLDTTFGSGGKAAAVPGYAAPGAMAIVNGSIVVAGGAFTAGRYAFSLVRYTAKGALDGTFGDAGTVVLPSPDHRIANDIAVDATGKLLLAGGGIDDHGTLLPAGGAFVVARVLETGALDPSFASNGVAVVDFGGTRAAAQGISVERDGSILAVGTRGSGSTLEIVASRLTAVGTLDTSFGVGGKLVVSLASHHLEAKALARHGCGLVVAGNAFDKASGGAPSFAIVRVIQ